MASQVHLNKSQCMTIAMSIINDIENFCEENSEAFQKFLKSEEQKKEVKNGKQRKRYPRNHLCNIR
jgi:hypothetical protein